MGEIGAIALKLIYNVGIMFLMMIPGIIMKKCKLTTDGFGKGLSNLVLYIAQPALIFMAYLRDFDAKILVNILWVLLFSVVAHVIFAVVAMKTFMKEEDGRRRMLRFCTVFSNAAFMGIPLIGKILGDYATIYASVYNITFNLFLWSFGVYLCTEGRDKNENGTPDHEEEGFKSTNLKSSLKKALLHPVTLAAGVGLIFFFLPINSYVPSLVTEGLTMLKELVIPLSMAVIGLRLADIDFRGIFKDKSMYLFLVLRHIALPVLVWGVVRLIAISGIISRDVIVVLVIMASAPAASSATMFAEKYECDAGYVSKLVSISTILSILTMPFVVMLAYI